jgi:protein ImuA
VAGDALAKADLHALRQVVAAIEAGRSHTGSLEDPAALDQGGRLVFGIEAFDERLAGGLPLKGLNEVRAAHTADAGAAAGFALALCALVRGGADQAAPKPMLWICEREAGREAGLAHAAGLKSFGLTPEHLIFAVPRRIEEALWVAEAALETEAFVAIVLEVRGNPAKFGLTESRRLHLKARNAGLSLFLLRQAGEEEASSAAVRLLVEAAPAAPRRIGGFSLAGTIGHPAFRITLEKSRNPAPFVVVMEWNANERQFYPAGPDTVYGGRPAHPHRPLPTPAGRPDSEDPMGRVLAFGRAS